MADNTVSSLELMGEKVINKSAINSFRLLALLQVATSLILALRKGILVVLKVMFENWKFLKETATQKYTLGSVS